MYMYKLYKDAYNRIYIQAAAREGGREEGVGGGLEEGD